MNVIPSTSVIKIKIPLWNSNALIEFLNNLCYAKEPLKKKAITRERISSRYGRRKPTETIGYTLTYKTGSNTGRIVRELENTFRAGFLTIETDSVPDFNSKLEWLEHLIKTFDKTYMFSDDHRYWLAGEHSKTLILSLIEELTAEGNTGEVRMIVEKNCKADEWLKWIVDHLERTTN